MNIFAHSTYKDFLRGYIQQANSRGVISAMAEACGCDRTYISQVLNGKADLTPDHMIQFCEHLNLNESESEYVLLLLLRDRSASSKVRKTLDTKIDTLRREALSVTHKVMSREKPKEIREELRTLYYSSWLYAAVHTLTSIEEFQTASAITHKLQVPSSAVFQVLKDLVQMQLVREEKNRFIHTGADIYLPRHSPQISAHHLSWRMKAVERTSIKDDVHYTTAFSVSRKDVEKLRDQIVHLIEEQRKLVRASGTDVACVFCADFFSL